VCRSGWTGAFELQAGRMSVHVLLEYDVDVFILLVEKFDIGHGNKFVREASSKASGAAAGEFHGQASSGGRDLDTPVEPLIRVCVVPAGTGLQYFRSSVTATGTAAPVISFPILVATLEAAGGS
jgi:hypothetical protein